MKVEKIEIKIEKTVSNNRVKAITLLATRRLDILLSQVSQQLNMSQLSQFK